MARRRSFTWLVSAALLLGACAEGEAARSVARPEVVDIPAGAYIAGSDRAEREMAYRLDEAAYGHSRTRQWRWYENEPDRGARSTDA